MMMTKEEAEERKKLIESLLKEGLTEREAAERMGVSEMTVYRNMKKFGIKANGKRQSFKVIGGRVLEDYKKGYKVVGKYGRFAVLQEKEYQITAMYDDFVRQAGSGGNG